MSGPWEKYQKKPWEKYQGMTGEPAPAPEAQDGPVDYEPLETVKNIPASGARYLGDIWAAVTNPMDVASVLAELGKEWITLDPADPETHETMTAIGDMLEHRYGSMDAFKRTAMEDPVGMIADLSGVLTATRLPKLAQLGKALEPTNALVSSARKMASKLPESMYASASKFPKGRGYSPARRQRMTQTALKYGVKPTYKGVEKLERYIAKYNDKVQQLLDVAEKSDQPIPVERLTRQLKQLRGERGSSFGLDVKADTDFITDVIKEMEDLAETQGRTHLTAKEVQRFKIDTYDKINFDARHLTGTPIQESARKAVARSAKEALEEVSPTIKDINADLADMYELLPALQTAANRVEDLDFIGLGPPTKAGAGYIIGDILGAPGAGTAIGTTAGILGKPPIKSGMAIGAHMAGKPIGQALDIIDRYLPPQFRYGASLAGSLLEEEQ